jgi:hypothetical protein
LKRGARASAHNNNSKLRFTMAEPAELVTDAPVKKESTPAQKDFQRKVRREAYLTSGFENETDKNRMVEAFHSAVWPKLSDLGWNKVSANTKVNMGESLLVDTHFYFFAIQLTDGDKTRFESPDKTNSFDRITDILSHVKANKSLAEVAKALKASLKGQFDDEVQSFIRRPRLQANLQHNRRGKLPKTRNKLRARQGALVPGELMAAWKYGGREFPKRSSQIGPQHQATKIPVAGSYLDPKQEGGEL